MASERLHYALSFNADYSTISHQKLSLIASKNSIIRSRELEQVGDTINSHSEWHYTLKRLSPEERNIAAHLAHTWKWPTRAIFAASGSSNRDNLEIRFPRTYRKTIIEQASKKKIDRSWVFSLIRQESAFRKTARSSAGAMGIMQILPNTAKHIAKKAGQPYQGAQALLNHKYNIDLGTRYLKQLMTKFNNNILVVTAAYNAGPNRARRWVPEYAMPGDVWVATIPFKETRNYVKNIMAYQAIYQYHEGLGIPNISAVLETVGKENVLHVQNSTVGAHHGS